jgi:hypothetical protein
VLDWNRPKASGLMGVAACPTRRTKAEGAAQPADAARRAHRVVTVHGTPAVAWPPASSHATRCGDTGGGSSSMKRRKHQARWYQRGRTEAAARRRGGGGGVGQRRFGGR